MQSDLDKPSRHEFVSTEAKYRRRSRTSLQLAQMLVHVVWRDDAQEVDVVIGVEVRHLRVIDERGALGRAPNKEPRGTSGRKIRRHARLHLAGNLRSGITQLN
jgi:hypothetical protein